MLKDIQFQEKPEKEELKRRLKASKDELFSRQMKLKEKRLPVIVLVEGWGTSGKGSIIGKVIQSIDPRFFKVAAITTPTPTGVSPGLRDSLRRFLRRESSSSMTAGGWMR